jgi:hypothetical protein
MALPGIMKGGPCRGWTTAREPRRQPPPQGRLECFGISGWLLSESPAALRRNARLASVGIRSQSRQGVRVGRLQFEVSSQPCLSQMANTFTLLTSLPPSMPRAQAVGPSGVSSCRPQPPRVGPHRRRPRASPGRATIQVATSERANVLCSVVKGYRRAIRRCATACRRRSASKSVRSTAVAR